MITLKRIISGESSILFITHEEEGGYQFLDGEDCTDEDASVIALELILKHDPTVAEIACLPPGFFATRKTADDAWEIGLLHDDEDGEYEDEDED